MIDDIEDDYADYLADELGYAWDAWDTLPAAAIRRHDEIAAAGADELAAVDPAALDDLERWAYARAARRHGDADGALEAVRLVLRSGDEHAGLVYADVFVAAIEELASHGACDEATLHLDAFRARWPEDGRAARLNVFVAARSGGLDGALELAREALRDDPEGLFEVAEDLVAVGEVARGRALLAEIDHLAADAGLRALATDVAVLMDALAATEE